jgi:hypothetical protein
LIVGSFSYEDAAYIIAKDTVHMIAVCLEYIICNNLVPVTSHAMKENISLTVLVLSLYPQLCVFHGLICNVWPFMVVKALKKVKALQKPLS